MSGSTRRNATPPGPELFFDLVAVAGVSVVAHQLETEQPWQHIAVLAIAFIAFWILWASVVTYGNLLANGTSMMVLFLSMAVLGAMAASVPEIYGDHARAFAIAYVVGRLLMARPWRRGAIVVDMPIVQMSVGVLPWIVSIWVEGDARYVWWAVGIALDLLGLLTNSGEKAIGEAQRRLDRMLKRRSEQMERAAARGVDVAQRAGRDVRALPAEVVPLRGDREHLSERMGLFVIIVLGEAIIQIYLAAQAAHDWNRALVVAALGAFAFVCAVFVIAVVRGTAGLALLESASLPARGLWLGHLFVAMSLVLVCAAVGGLLEDPHEPVGAHTAGMLALGLAAYAATSACAHLASRAPRARVLAAAVAGPMLATAAIVALAYDSLSATAVGWILAAGVAVAAALGRRHWSASTVKSE